MKKDLKVGDLVHVVIDRLEHIDGYGNITFIGNRSNEDGTTSTVLDIRFRNNYLITGVEEQYVEKVVKVQSNKQKTLLDDFLEHLGD